MTLDAAAERERVYARYAPFGRRDLVWWMATFAVAFVASRFVHVDWLGFVGLLVSAGVWETTKFRLRRNADRFLGSSTDSPANQREIPRPT